MKTKTIKFKVGDRVQIIDIHPTDGTLIFGCGAELINKTGTIIERKMNSPLPDVMNWEDGYTGCRILLDTPTQNFKNPLFYMVQLKKL